MSINISATTYTVTSVTDSGAGSLRQAITDANANVGADDIHFNISQSDCDTAGVCHIVVSSNLPTITEALIIDGSTQPKYGTAPANVCATQSDASYMRIELNTTGYLKVLILNSPEASVVKGLSIGGETTSADTAIYLNGNGEYWVNCNHLGVNAEGTEKLNLSSGICLGCSGQGNNGIIGTNSDGTNDISERNVITANLGIYHNGWKNYITAGNYFGLTADGLTGLNSTTCIFGRQSSGNRIGSDLDGFADIVERNIFGGCNTAISYSTYGSSQIKISGNWIGVNANGTSLVNSIAVGLNLDSSTTSNPSYLVASNWIDSAIDSAINLKGISLLANGSNNNCITDSTIGLTHSGTSINQPFTDNYWGDTSGPSGVGTGTGAEIVYSSTGTIIYSSFQPNCSLDIPSPSVVLTKSTGVIDDIDNSSSISVGDVINYSFTIENTGNTTLTNLIVSDPGASTLNGSPVASILVGSIDTTSVTATHTITQADIDFGSFSNQASISATANGIIGIASDVSDDPMNNTDSIAACPGAATACDPTITALKLPIYDSTPVNGSDLVFTPVNTNSPNPTVLIDISNNGDLGSTLMGSCLISGSDANKFSFTSDATFSIAQGASDTETVACNNTTSGVFNASLDCNHNGENGPVASYPLVCAVTDLDGFISDGTAIFGYVNFDNTVEIESNFSAIDDNLFAMWYLYRLSGDRAETSLPTPDSVTYIDDTATLDWNDVNNNGLFDAQLVHVINQPIQGSATLVSTLKLTSLTNTDVGIDVFNYFDFDVLEDYSINSAVLTNDPDFMTISDTSVVEQRAGGNDNYQVTSYSDIADFLDDAFVNNLDNTGLPFSPDDFTGAFQWQNVTVPAGGSYTIQTTSSIDTAAPVPNLPVVVINNAPTTVNDNYTLNEDGILTADDVNGSVNDTNDDGVLVNDNDVELDSFTAVLDTTTTHGTLTLNANGSFDYVPDANYCDEVTPDTFTYHANDGISNSNIATVSITVNCIADVPVADNDSYFINEDTTLNQPVLGVLIGDIDVDGDSLTAVLDTTTNHGTLSLSANGSFDYIPTADYCDDFTPDTFTYHANDGTDDSNIATVNIKVNCVNDAPSFDLLFDIDVTNQIGPDLTQIQILDFAENIVFGPTNENTQNVQQFNLIVNDSNSILNNISLNNNGTLNIDFSLNFGVALIDVTLQDNGGTNNGGNDTSSVIEFVVSHMDLVFANGFESSGGFKLFDHIDSLSFKYPLNNHPTYDFNDDKLHFYGHHLQLKNSYNSQRTLLLVKYWMQEILILEDPFGDFDQDGILNNQDRD